MSGVSMQLPPAVVRHLISALEVEVARLEKIADTIGDDDWPHDYDPNDLALFRGGLSALRKTAESGGSQDWACNKPCRFMIGLLPGYVRSNLSSLSESDYSAVFHAYAEFTMKCCLELMARNRYGSLFTYADFLDREVIRQLASFPDRMRR